MLYARLPFPATVHSDRLSGFFTTTGINPGSEWLAEPGEITSLLSKDFSVRIISDLEATTGCTDQRI